MLKTTKILLIISILSSPVIGCTRSQPAEEAVPSGSQQNSLTITSTAFVDGSNIPIKYTCNGQNISPELNWSEGPAGTESFVLIMDDPDAVYTHWVVYNLPSDLRGLPEAIPKDEEPAVGGLQGKIGSGGIGYPTGYFVYPICS